MESLRVTALRPCIMAQHGLFTEKYLTQAEKYLFSFCFYTRFDLLERLGELQQPAPAGLAAVEEPESPPPPGDGPPGRQGGRLRQRGEHQEVEGEEQRRGDRVPEHHRHPAAAHPRPAILSKINNMNMLGMLIGYNTQ